MSIVLLFMLLYTILETFSLNSRITKVQFNSKLIHLKIAVAWLVPGKNLEKFYYCFYIVLLQESKHSSSRTNFAYTQNE